MRLVIVDDGSPEADFAAVRALAEAQELPVSLARNPTNRGRPYTRNRLLDAVEAPYVAWLDAGDVWHPGKLERQFDHMSRLRFQGADVDRLWITCHYDWQWEGRRIRLIRQEVETRQLRELMLGRRLRAYLWTLLGTARAFKAAGRFDERLPRLQDLDYFLRFIQGGGALVVPPGEESLCRYHKSDLGRDAGEIRRCNRLIFEQQVQPEQELLVRVTAAEAALVTHGDREPGDVRVDRGDRTRERGGCLGIGLRVAGVLEQVLGEADDAAAEDVEGMVGERGGQAAGMEDAEDHVDVGDDRRPLRPILQQARRPRVPAHHLARPKGLAAHRGSPVRLRIDDRDLAQDDIAQPVEQVVLVADVAVQRHGIDAERLAQAPHAQPLEAALVGEPRPPPRGSARGSAAHVSQRPRRCPPVLDPP